MNIFKYYKYSNNIYIIFLICGDLLSDMFNEKIIITKRGIQLENDKILNPDEFIKYIYESTSEFTNKSTNEFTSDVTEYEKDLICQTLAYMLIYEALLKTPVGLQLKYKTAENLLKNLESSENNKFENNKFEINKSENNKSEKVYYYQINKLPALKKYVLKHYYQNYRQLIKIILLLLLTYTIISYLIIFPDW